jgi:hypothetical protein
MSSQLYLSFLTRSRLHVHRPKTEGSFRPTAKEFFGVKQPRDICHNCTSCHNTSNVLHNAPNFRSNIISSEVSPLQTWPQAVGENVWRELAEFYRQKAKLLGENPAPVPFCLSQNFTMIERGSISGLRGKRQVTDLLTHAADFRTLQFV